MLTFDHVFFSFDGKTVLSDFSLKVEKGEIVALMGESGIGKSTLLNLAAGLLHPQKGSIKNHSTKISYAFQEPRLFPWMTALENVNAVLSGKGDTLPTAQKALDFVYLGKDGQLYPNELSGGMKTRVSIARAIAYDGDLYLLDEPFSALDAELREKILLSLRNHLKERGATALFVTHQHEEAERFADRIVSV